MLDSPPPSYSFHGSNSSHSKDNGSGGRTYHIPNYATSYANERSNLISVTFDEDKKTSKAIIAVVIVFLLFAAVPLSLVPVMRRSSQKIDTCQDSRPKSEPELQSLRTREWASNSSPVVNDLEYKHEEKSFKSDKDVGHNLKGEVLAETRIKEPRADLKASKLYWDELTPNDHCLAFGKREYTAKLQNVPFYVNWAQACQNTEVTIHGIRIERPTSCESKWPFGGVIGHWIVDVDEQDCLANWGNFVDKGCVNKGPSKLRRFQSRLWNIKAGEDWMTICKTAPANIHGISISKPMGCNDQGLWGIYGIWDLEDDSC